MNVLSSSSLHVNEQKKKVVVVAEALSDLVIYTKSVKFTSFTHSKDNQNFFENTSMANNTAQKLAKTSGKMNWLSFIDYTFIVLNFREERVFKVIKNVHI